MDKFYFKHEYKKSAFGKIDNIFDFYPKDKVYDPCIDDTVCFGGTTTIAYNTKKEVVHVHHTEDKVAITERSGN